MTRVVFLALVICLSRSILKTRVWGEEAEEGRVILTGKVFESFRNTKSPFLLIAHSANSPKESEVVKAISKQLISQSSIGGLQIPVAQLELDQEHSLSLELKVNDNGSLYLILKDKVLPYSGAMEAEDISRWVAKKVGSPADHIKKVSDLLRLQEQGKSLIYFLPDNEDKAIDAFIEAAREIDYPCAYVDDESMKETENISGKYILVHRNSNKRRSVNSQEQHFSAKEILAFEDMRPSDSVAELDKDAATRIFAGEKVEVIFFGPNYESWFGKEAEKNHFGLSFFHSKPDSEFSNRLIEYLNLDPKVPEIRIIKMFGDDMRTFRCPTNGQGFSQCLDDFAERKLKPVYKSQPVPEKNNDPVRVIVGETFQEEVIDSDKHVLLEIYAPWCGHCKHLEPIYLDLAKKMAASKELVIAKFDGTANDAPGLNVSGYPTIKLFKKGEKTRPVDFSGERTVPNFIKFLEKELGIVYEQVY